MIPFLKSVARAYARRYDDLSGFCFLFPNKRSGTFFLKYLREEAGGKAMLMPDIQAVSDFVARLSGRVVASRLDQLFMLYACYCRLLGVEADDEEGVRFDEFRTWGETVLSDFSDVDMQLVDPHEIFKNVKDFREIASNFLSPEQREVLEEYFGHYEPEPGEGLWKMFEDEDNLTGAKRRFLHLWRVLAPLYESLTADLEARGLTTQGGAYRGALARIEGEGRKCLKWDKVVVVGFNALSASERSIFAALRDMEGEEGEPYADFFWDATGPVLNGGINSASRFVKSNIKRYPCPEWALPVLRESDRSDMPAGITECPAPSNAIQVKIAGNLLSGLRDTLPEHQFEDARVAVVLADENLLLPMLYSLPQGLGTVNLTMGYSLRLTAVVPFVTHLRHLFGTMRVSDGMPAFYHKGLRRLVAHPLAETWLGNTAIGRFTGWLDRHHVTTVTAREVRNFLPQLGLALMQIKPDMAHAALTRWLDRMLESVSEAVGKRTEGNQRHLEQSHIQVYRDALRRLADLLAEYPLSMRPRTLFKLIDRLLAAETVRFEGEPLSGLQIMGTLETRSLDFDHIILLSANERILPMRARTRTFIPDSLRRAFGMPPSRYAEEIFAYYFYRMISRAQSVTLAYDSRSASGARSAGESRYIVQLRHLFAKDTIKRQAWKFMLSGREPHDAYIPKTGTILNQLKKFEAPGGGANLSSSALMNYRDCQVKFFLKHVAGLQDDTRTEYISAIEIGNVLHACMADFYLPREQQGRMLNPPVMVSREHISGILNDPEGILRLVTRHINREHFHRHEEELDAPLDGSSQIVAQSIVTLLCTLLEQDLGLAPFGLYGCEIAEKLEVDLPSGRRVNFKFAIDRLDVLDPMGSPRLRIVDYKTGAPKVTATGMADLFAAEGDCKHSFQLFSYAWLLNRRGGIPGSEQVILEIYNPANISNTDRKGKNNPRPHLMVPLPQPKGNKKWEFAEMDYAEHSADFAARIAGMAESIFTDKEFLQAEDPARCAGCAFSRLCRR